MKSIYARQAFAMFAFCLSLAGHAATDINGAGSSAAKPLYTKWADFYGHNIGTVMHYDPAGSSAGVKRIKEGSVDFGATDVALSADDLKKNRLICFPTAISGVVPVYNLPGIKPGELQLTGELLADIFSRTIVDWNDPAIKAVNPGLNLPKLPISIIVRAEGSGTTYNFTNYLSKISPAWKHTFGNDFLIKWPATATPVKGSGGIVTAVKSTAGALGYVDYNYVVQDQLSYAKVRNRDGRFVKPGADEFGEALTNSDWKGKAAFEEMLTDRPGLHSWPITMGTFVVIPLTTKNPETTAATLRFFTWAFMKGDQLVGDVDFVRLPDMVQARIYGDMTRVSDVNGEPLKWLMPQ